MQKLLRSLQTFLFATMLMFAAVGSLTLAPAMASADTNLGATQSVLAASDWSEAKMWLSPDADSAAEAKTLASAPNVGAVAQRCSQIGEYCFKGEGCCPELTCYPHRGDLGICVPSD